MARLAAIGVALMLGAHAGAQGLPEREFGEPWNGVGVGARALGMAGAYTALSDDMSGVYWNPAGLIQMRDTQAGVMTGSPYWTREPGNIVKDLGMFGFVTTAFRPWVAGFTAFRNFHSESIVPWQENVYMFTFVVPNSSRTAGVGLNVKYIKSDSFYESPLAADPVLYNDTSFYLLERDGDLFDGFGSVRGWAADVGVHYNIPLPVRDRRRQLNFGVNLRNALGQSEVAQRSRAWPAQVLTGVAWIFDDLVPREPSVFSLNYDVALSARLGRESSQYRLGFEQWFNGNSGAIRMGYASPLPLYDPIQVADGYFSQGRPVFTVGATLRGTDPAVRTVLGLGLGSMAESAQLDIAVTLPTGGRATIPLPGVPENEGIRQSNPNGILPADTTRFYMQVTWHWMAMRTSPRAEARVQPLVFAPKKGEMAVFTMEAADRNGIESWDLVIKNSARVPVRTFSGKGEPPTRLMWDGLDSRFNLVPDDEHTYQLQVRNREGVETITPPAPLRVFTPGEGPGPGDPSLIFKVLDQNAKREAAERGATGALIDGKLQELKWPLGVDRDGGTLFDESAGELWYPALPSDTLAIAAEGTATQYASFRGIEAGQVTRYDVSGPGGEAVLEYETMQYVFKYLAREVRMLTQQSFQATGTGVARYIVRAQYGGRLLEVVTPMEVARDLASGRLDDRRWLRASRVTLDGEEIEPMIE